MLKRAVHRVTPARSVKRNYGDAERKRLARLPRYLAARTNLPGSMFIIPDAASFLASWEEIFDREIYDFKCSSQSPRILDCGANVGVSCLYFHRRFPNAKITAFEPDPFIFKYLKENMDRAGVTNVELVKKAVWVSRTQLNFASEGSDAGRIDGGSEVKTIEVATVRLRDYLNEQIDLLKMDIEGAECDVMADIAPFLSNVLNIFVEYHSFTERPQKLDSLIKILTEAGFRLQIHHMSVSPKPLVEVRSHLGMDMQLNIFAYRPAGKTIVSSLT